MQNEPFYISDEIIGTKLGTRLVFVMEMYESLYHAYYHDNPNYREDYRKLTQMLSGACARLAILFDRHGTDGRLFELDDDYGNRKRHERVYKDVCMAKNDMRFAYVLEAVIRVSNELYYAWLEPDKFADKSAYDLYDEVNCLRSWALEMACMATCSNIGLIFGKPVRTDVFTDLAFRREHMGIDWYMKTNAELREELRKQNGGDRRSIEKGAVGVGFEGN